VDPYAADEADFAEGDEIDESGISADEEDTQKVGRIA